MDLYCKGVVWGLVIGWLICPSHNYGKHIWKANVERFEIFPKTRIDV